jgi:hypothetical protein
MPWRTRRGILMMGKRELLRLAEAECSASYRRGVIAGIPIGAIAGVLTTAVVCALRDHL